MEPVQRPQTITADWITVYEQLSVHHCVFWQTEVVNRLEVVVTRLIAGILAVELLQLSLDQAKVVEWHCFDHFAVGCVVGKHFI